MNYNKSFFGLLMALFVLLPGCIHVPFYTRRSFLLVSDDCTYKATQDQVTIEAKKLSNSDIRYLFDERSDLLSYKKIDAIYIAIYNLSNSKYILGPESISLEQVPYAKIDKSMKKANSVARLAAGAAGITAGALGQRAINSGSSSKDFGGFVALGTFSSLSYILGSIGIGTGVQSVFINRRITKDLKEKTLSDSVVIKPGGHYEGIVFVKFADYNPQFRVAMHEKNNVKNRIVFDVDVTENK